MTARFASNRPLRCAIETSQIVGESRPTGIGRYVAGLLGGFEQLQAESPDALQLTQLYRGSLSRWRNRGRLVHGPGFKQQMWRDAWWPLLRRYDLVHCPDDRIPPWRGPACVSTIHDLFAMIEIDVFENDHERERRAAQYLRLVERSDQLICVSEHTRQDLLRYTPARAERTHVVHLGVSSEFCPQPAAEREALRAWHRLHRPYLLFVGAYRPYKNLTRLLQAFAASGMAQHYDLVLIGTAGANEKARYDALTASLGLSDAVRQLGYVADAELPKLYAAAAAFLFPSLYEGFGLPILEALACATPVLTSNAASCPEVANGHAVLVDPYDIDSIAAGLVQVVETSAEQREAARAYAQTKTWLETAKQTLKVYQLATRRTA